MIAAPAEKPRPEPVPNLHAGAAAASAPSAPVLGPKGINVERPNAAKDALDEAADLFKVIFKGEIIP